MDVEFDLKDIDLSGLVLNPSEDSLEVDEKLIGDEVDASILAQFAPKTKSAYERCKKRYEEMKHEVHSEESVLACLMKYHKEKEFKPPTLWTMRSLILCYLKHECKVKVTDMRTSKWLKALSGIFKEKKEIELYLTHIYITIKRRNLAPCHPRRSSSL
jgi:hypothetical protein